MSNELIEHESITTLDEKSVQLAEELAIDLDQTTNQLMSSAAHKINSAYKNIVESGIFLQKVKSECAHGEFGQLCEKHGFPKQRAQEAMKYAEVAAALPKARRGQILELPKKKVLLLASAGQEAIDKALEDDDFAEDLASLSYTEMREKIKGLESENADLTVELETKSEREKELKSKLNNKSRASGLPDYIDIIRNESNAVAEQIALCGDSMQGLLDELTTAMDADDSSLGALEKFNQLGAVSLLVQARAAAAHVLQAYNSIQSQLGGFANINDELPADAIFSEAEIQQALLARSELTRSHEQERIIRENELASKKPRKRGAPKKPKAIN